MEALSIRRHDGAPSSVTVCGPVGGALYSTGMKIGMRTTSLGQLGDTLPGAIEAAARLGFDGLEAVTRDAAQIRGWPHEDGRGGVGAVRDLAGRAGCAIASFSLALFRPVTVAQDDEALRQQGLARLTNALRAGANVGGTAVLVPFFDRQRLDASAAGEARFVEGLRTCARVAAAASVGIALETSFSVVQLQRLAHAVGSPCVGVYQDLANAIVYQQDPAATLRALGPAVAMVHVKDTQAGGGNTRLGEGVVDWASCRSALRGIGYDGGCVLETPPGGDPLASAARHLAFTRRWLSERAAARPGRRGSSWASRESGNTAQATCPGRALVQRPERWRD